MNIGLGLQQTLHILKDLVQLALILHQFLPYEKDEDTLARYRAAMLIPQIRNNRNNDS